MLTTNTCMQIYLQWPNDRRTQNKWHSIWSIWSVRKDSGCMKKKKWIEKMGKQSFQIMVNYINWKKKRVEFINTKKSVIHMNKTKIIIECLIERIDLLMAYEAHYISMFNRHTIIQSLKLIEMNNTSWKKKKPNTLWQSFWANVRLLDLNI